METEHLVELLVIAMRAVVHSYVAPVAQAGSAASKPSTAKPSTKKPATARRRPAKPAAEN
jgi:hypothetical protein